MTNNPETKLILCNCHRPEHQLILTYFPDDALRQAQEPPNEKEMYVQVHLVTYDNFFKRLWTGLRFAFGYHCRYGEWDELILTVEEGKEVWDFLGGFLGGKDTGVFAPPDDAEWAALNRAVAK